MSIDAFSTVPTDITNVEVPAANSHRFRRLLDGLDVTSTHQANQQAGIQSPRETRKYPYNCNPRSNGRTHVPDMVRTMNGSWWQRHAPKLAVALTITCIALLAIVIVQAEMLYLQGWRLNNGSVPDWIAGIGSLAAFGALYFAASEWRSAHRAKRDSEANQARLVSVERLESAEPFTYAIRNRSHSSVFDLYFHDGETASRMNELHPRTHTGGKQAYSGIGRTGWDVLAPDQATGPISTTIVLVAGTQEPLSLPIAQIPPSVDAVVFSFTDAEGRRWKRTGIDKLERIFSTSGN